MLIAYCLLLGLKTSSQNVYMRKMCNSFTVWMNSVSISAVSSHTFLLEILSISWNLTWKPLTKFFPMANSWSPPRVLAPVRDILQISGWPAGWAAEQLILRCQSLLSIAANIEGRTADRLPYYKWLLLSMSAVSLSYRLVGPGSRGISNDTWYFSSWS